MTKPTALTGLMYLLAMTLSTPSWSGSVSGIIKSDNGRLVNHARVKAWDKDPASKDDLLGKVMTNKKGRYNISYKSKRWDGAKEGPKLNSNKPDIYLTVEIRVRGNWELIGTSKVHKDFDQNKALRINLSNVNRRNAFVRRTIYGVIKNKKGKVVPGVIVTAWDKDWGKPELMGKATTNNSGQYRIAYSKRNWDGFKSGFSFGKSSNPDIFITIKRVKNKKQLAKSSVFKNHPVGKRLKINLRVKN